MGQVPRHYKQNMAHQLRGFYHVARCGSFTKAAAQIFLEQPSLSLQVKALERELDVKLFDRLGRSIQLTPEGQVLLDLAAPLVEGLESLKEDFNARRGYVDTSPLKVAAGESMILYFLPDLVASFPSRFPHVRVELLTIRHISEVIPLLYEGGLDLAITIAPTHQRDINGLEFAECYVCDMVLIASPGHQLSKLNHMSLEDIAAVPLVLGSRESTVSQIIDSTFERSGLAYTAAMHAGSAEGQKRYVDLGMGVAILPAICVTKEETSRFSIVSVSEFFGKRRYAVATRKGKSLSRPAREFIQMISDHSGAPGVAGSYENSLV